MAKHKSKQTPSSCRHGQSWLLTSRSQSRKQSWKVIQSRYEAATIVDRKGQLPGFMPNKDLQRLSSTIAQTLTIMAGSPSRYEATMSVKGRGQLYRVSCNEESWVALNGKRNCNRRLLHAQKLKRSWQEANYAIRAPQARIGSEIKRK